MNIYEELKYNDKLRGSRIGLEPAIYCDLGDGTGLFVVEDFDGNYLGFKALGVCDEMFETTEEVADFVKSTWEE